MGYLIIVSCKGIVPFTTIFFFKKEITTIFGASRKHMQMQSFVTVPQQASGHDRCTRKSNAVQVRSDFFLFYI